MSKSKQEMAPSLPEDGQEKILGSKNIRDWEQDEEGVFKLKEEVRKAQLEELKTPAVIDKLKREIEGVEVSDGDDKEGLEKIKREGREFMEEVNLLTQEEVADNLEKSLQELNEKLSSLLLESERLGKESVKNKLMAFHILNAQFRRGKIDLEKDYETEGMGSPEKKEKQEEATKVDSELLENLSGEIQNADNINEIIEILKSKGLMIKGVDGKIIYPKDLANALESDKKSFEYFLHFAYDPNAKRRELQIDQKNYTMGFNSISDGVRDKVIQSFDRFIDIEIKKADYRYYNYDELLKP